MEEDQDEMLDMTSNSVLFDSEITDLSNLINIILDYYSFSQQGEDEGEEWRKGTSHEHKTVPDDIDKLVGKAFKVQLKKFTKE